MSREDRKETCYPVRILMWSRDICTFVPLYLVPHWALTGIKVMKLPSECLAPECSLPVIAERNDCSLAGCAETMIQRSTAQHPLRLEVIVNR